MSLPPEIRELLFAGYASVFRIVGALSTLCSNSVTWSDAEVAPLLELELEVPLSICK